MQKRSIEPIGSDASLLIADEGEAFGIALAGELRARGFDPHVATCHTESLQIVRNTPSAYAVIELRIAGEMSLDILEGICHARP